MENKKENAMASPSIFYLPDKEFIDRFYPHRRLRGFFIGGLCYPSNGEIFIKESRRHDEKLLLHEIGHIKGYLHTKHFTIMNKSWAFRWFKSYYPYKD